MVNPTPEQEAIVSAFATTSENIAVRALAGTGKTTTLTQIVEATAVPTLAIAFNKENAKELQSRMPSHCECRTMHSTGLRATTKWLGRKVVVDFNKIGGILREEIKSLSKPDADVAWKAFNDITSAIGEAYSSGWVPKGFQISGLVSDTEFFSSLDFEPTTLECQLIHRVMDKSITLALQGKLSFDDMVYIPALWPVQFNPYALTLVDETQDLSLLNHRLVEKLTGKERLGIVGDPFQAIYAFRGAHETSMALLQEKFSMCELPLTTAFRCPRAVIEHVQWRAPDMKPTEWAREGSVSTLGEWSHEDIPDGSFIICRNNAPLFRLALNLIRAGRRPEVLGNDVTKGIVKALKAISTDLRMPSESAISHFQPEADRLRKRYRNSKTIEDKIACITYFLEDQETLGLAIARAEQIMTQTGTVKLMTGHKSKGLEAENVFFLDSHLLGDEGQEPNLRYVICTRSKDALTYVDSEGFVL